MRLVVLIMLFLLAVLVGCQTRNSGSVLAQDPYTPKLRIPETNDFTGKPGIAVSLHRKSNFARMARTKLETNRFLGTWSGDGPSNVSKLIACQRTSDRTICRIVVAKCTLERTCTRTISRVLTESGFTSVRTMLNTRISRNAGREMAPLGLLSEH